jgi:hypothetical protein
MIERRPGEASATHGAGSGFALIRPAAITTFGSTGGSPAPRHGDTALGLPADFLIEPDGRVREAKYGRHASDHWPVDELIRLARAPEASPRHHELPCRATEPRQS